MLGGGAANLFSLRELAGELTFLHWTSMTAVPEALFVATTTRLKLSS